MCFCQLAIFAMGVPEALLIVLPELACCAWRLNRYKLNLIKLK